MVIHSYISQTECACGPAGIQPLVCNVSVSQSGRTRPSTTSLLLAFQSHLVALPASCLKLVLTAGGSSFIPHWFTFASAPVSKILASRSACFDVLPFGLASPALTFSGKYLSHGHCAAVLGGIVLPQSAFVIFWLRCHALRGSSRVIPSATYSSKILHPVMMCVCFHTTKQFSHTNWVVLQFN